MKEHAWWSERYLGKNAVRAEWITAALCLEIVFLVFRDFLSGGTTVVHDALTLNLPVHHYMAHSLLQGRLPLWNPYTHGGEPFFPLLGHLRLYEPFSVLVVWIGSFFTRETVLLFNWDKFLQTSLNLGGVYLLLRSYSRTLVSKLVLIIVLSFSSLLLCSFRQDGFLSQFVWVPFLMFFSRRIFFERDYRWLNFWGAALCLGLKWQSYWFVGALTVFLFFLVSALLFYREELASMWRSPSIGWKLGGALALNLMMMAPNFQVFQIRDRFDYPLRANLQAPGEAPKGTNILDSPPQYTRRGTVLNYETVIQTGAPMTIWDYLQLVVPVNRFAPGVEGFQGAWGLSSEASLYLGAMAWLVTLVGLFLSRGRERAFWLCQCIGFGLISMGPFGGLHRVLYYIYPPLWFLRNTHSFVLLLAPALLYFMVCGIDCLVSWMEGSSPAPEFPRAQWRWAGLYTIIISGAMWACVSAEYPASLYNPLFIFLAAAIGWLWRKRISPLGFVYSLLAMQLVISLGYQPKLPPLILWWFWNIVLPLAVFTFALKVRSANVRRAGNLVFGLLVGLLACDLVCFLPAAWSKYQSPPPVKTVASANTLSAPAPFPVTRQPYDYFFVRTMEHYFPFYYHSLLSKKTSVLTPIWGPEDHQRLDRALQDFRFSTLITPRAHSDLVYSKLNADVLGRIFGVGRPLLQFRADARRVEPGGVVPFLEARPPAAAAELIDTTVLLEAPTLSLPPPVAPVGSFSYEVTDFTESGLKVSVRSGSPGYFIWLDGFDPDWTATVDGIPAKVYRANGFAKAIPIESGEHSVSFDYVPVAFLRALALFWGGFFVGLVSLILCGLFTPFLVWRRSRFAIA